MTRRVKVVVLTCALALPALPAAAAVDTVSTSSSKAWACAGVYAIDTGVCVYNPIPRPDDLPTLPRL